jgi:hypothetical protein
MQPLNAVQAQVPGDSFGIVGAPKQARSEGGKLQDPPFAVLNMALSLSISSRATSLNKT